MYFLSSKVPQSNFRCHRLGEFIYDSCRGICGPSAARGYLFDDDGKSAGRARTLFTGGFQRRQSIPPNPPAADRLPARVTSSPSPLPHFAVSSSGTWHSCQSCAISEAAGAA